jgi:hypothetical protein
MKRLQSDAPTIVFAKIVQPIRPAWREREYEAGGGTLRRFP